MKTLTSMLAFSAALVAAPAIAQETGDAPPPDPDTQPAPDADDTTGQIYTSADFERFAPNNALDMLSRVPGFSIRGSDQQRGLGQASGNVLLNGARPSSKSDDIFAQLTRIPAENVERIEIVDGATLEIPGLSGQVANVVFRNSELKGQFSWRPQFRTNFTDPFLTSGAISISGRSGNLGYEVGLNNRNSGRGGAGGETLIRDAAGDLVETRDEVVLSFYDSPQLSANLTWDATADSVAHLNLTYQRIFQRFREDGVRIGGSLPDRDRFVRGNDDRGNYEIGADYEFPLGPGRLKVIGLYGFDERPSETTILTEFRDGSPREGLRFTRAGEQSEIIGRGEYTFPLFGGDMQIAAEAALNSLDSASGLFTLDPATDDFVEMPFPGGTGMVDEDRYEALVSYGRSITDNLSLQLIAGAENSTVSTVTGASELTREFTRPKGSATLAWNPYPDLDISLKAERRVLQLSFGNFLAQANLNDGIGNDSNNRLRPQQDWSFEGEINKRLGDWGSTQFVFVYRDVQDYVDIVPLPGGGEGVGNIDSAWARAVVWNSTITFDPIGLTGVRGDLRMVFQESQLRDPFTGELRQWSGFTDRQIGLSLRHDIPGSDWAYGFSANYSHNQPGFRSNQSQRDWEGPTFADVFVEHKDVFGLNVRAYVANIFDARQYRERTVYAGLRSSSAVLFTEDRDRLIGPIFGFNVSGSF